MNNEELISIIIPVYNAEQYIAECIDSIIQQTYQNWEIIAINDGSSDRSAEILNQYALKDNRIRVIHQANGGVSQARNVGIEKAEGVFITFVDSDDTIETDIYEQLTNLMKKYNADITHCSYTRLLQSGKKFIGNSGSVYIHSPEEALVCLVSGKLFTGSTCNKLYKRKLFENIRFSENIKINEDVLVNFKVFQLAEKIVFCDVCKYNYRVSESSACKNTNVLKKYADCVIVAEEMYMLANTMSVKDAASIRLTNSLIDQYRVIIYSKGEKKKLIKKINNRLQYLESTGMLISEKKRIEWKLMKWAPYAYKILYKIYDRIRIPNWDV